ncbi:MAG: hypothetical protein LBK99_03475 [Opitutaceae bacterium]|jgi:hypothetical protein|nr:hypothetical protein [Opitutaceae bacterium]
MLMRLPVRSILRIGISISVTTTLALAGLSCFAASRAFAQTLRQPGLTLEAKAWDDIRIQDGNGKPLLTLTGLDIKQNPRAKTTGGVIRQITTSDGQPALEVAYELTTPEGSPSPLKLTGRFVPESGRVDVTWTLAGLPDDANINRTMFGRRLANGATELPIEKPGLWKRHAHGGQPQEHPDGKFARYQIDDKLITLAFDSDNRVNLAWKDGRAHHIGFVKSAAAPAISTARFSIIFTPGNWPVELISARWHARPLSLRIDTGKHYNWWESEKDRPAGQQPELTLNATLANAIATASRHIVIKHWIRDFAGNHVSRATREIDLAPGKPHSETIRFRPSPASIDPARDIFFAEVSVHDKTTGKELAFARTNLTLLPPHEYMSTPADSIFGIAAYWPYPDEASIRRLMERMGVRWLRNGDTRSHKNIIANHTRQIPKTRYDDDPVAGDKWIREQLQICVGKANHAWEFGNEINYAVLSIGMGDTVKAQERVRRVERYLGWVKAIRRIQKEMGPPAANVKLLSLGLAGMDVVFADAIQAGGGWKLLDGLALHPGRGNFTPDYPVSEPWQNWKGGAYGNYWNYYGSLRTAAGLVKKYGDTPQKPKELWLTEVYACTYPNSFWEDSLRHAAGNTILSFALAMSENVKALMWYQLLDSVWHDQLGVKPDDREYYFGLVNRDLSPKPALLGYMTAAEELDQATFVRWLRFDTPSKTRGLRFDTPRGPLTILWDRTDGYILTKKVKDFASPEPWMDEWRSQIAITLPVAPGRASITVINEIGQRQDIPVTATTATAATATTATTATGPAVTLKLTGAPVIIYGLDAEKLK